LWYWIELITTATVYCYLPFGRQVVLFHLAENRWVLRNVSQRYATIPPTGLERPC